MSGSKQVQVLALHLPFWNYGMSMVVGPGLVHIQQFYEPDVSDTVSSFNKNGEEMKISLIYQPIEMDCPEKKNRQICSVIKLSSVSGGGKDLMNTSISN